MSDRNGWQAESGIEPRQDPRGECNRGSAKRQGHRWCVACTLLVLCAVSILGGVSAAWAALDDARYSRDAEQLFTRAVTAYEGGDLEEARARFDAVLELPANQRTAAALLMLSRALLRLEKHALAIEAARRLVHEAPQSRYVADARLVEGDGYHALKRYYEAADRYALILEGDGPLEVRASAAERLAAIVRNRSITAGALDGIRLRLGPENLRDALLYGEGRWYGRLGWHDASRQRLQAYVDSIGSQGAFHRLARRQLDGAGRYATPVRVVDLPPPPAPAPETDRWEPAAGREDVPRLGVLVPLTGGDGDIGHDLLAGVRYANGERGEPFDLVWVDTGTEYTDSRGQAVPIYQSDANRMVRVVAGTRFLIEEVGVQAIIGPVFSTSCAAAAAGVEAAGVPLLAPLAQQSGLDTLGRHLFQLNPIPEVQGQALAEYATLVLGLETLAILSPLSDYGYAFEQAFAEAAIANGGRIVHSDWYVPDVAKDFQVQFEALRAVGFTLAPPADAADSLAVFDSLEVALLDTTLEGEWMFQELVEAAGALGAGEPPDSTEIFIDAIDGVAVVAESFGDASTIAPQLRFHRLQTQLLGNDVWYDPEAIAQLPPQERVHVRGCAFVSRRQGSPQEQDFVDRFRTATGRDPGFAAPGYDAAQLVIDGWLAGHRTPGELRQYLADLRQYEGASGRLSFTAARRVNSELALLRIDDRGRVRSLGEEDLPALAPPDADADLPAEDWRDELPQRDLRNEAPPGQQP